LEIFRMRDEAPCLAELEIFDIPGSLERGIAYATSRSKGIVLLEHIQDNAQNVSGCNIREERRGNSLLNALDVALNRATNTDCFSVVIGPPLSSDCNFVSDWLSQEQITDHPLRNLYQIEYACRLETLTRNYAIVNRTGTPMQFQSNLAAMSMTVQTSTLISAISLFLRFHGWKNIAIVFEVTDESMQNSGVAETIQLFFSKTESGTAPLNVFIMEKLQWQIDPRMLLKNFTLKTDALLLLARPTLAAFFLRSVKDLPVFKRGEIAIIQIDPPNFITYDSLRFWRIVLDKQMQMGAAGNSLFIMTALPYGPGYDAQSDIFQSVRSSKVVAGVVHKQLNVTCLFLFLQQKTLVLAASAGAMAITLTQMNFEANNNTLPHDRDFFQPLFEKPLTVPVLPNVTFSFARTGDFYNDWYDFYFFALNPELGTSNRSIATMQFAEIFDLTSVILSPLDTVRVVKEKVWPNNSTGPKTDFCLHAKCNEVVSSKMVILIIAEFLCICALAGTVALFFRRHQQSMQLRRGINKLVLYPDDVEFAKSAPMQKKKHSTTKEPLFSPKVTFSSDVDLGSDKEESINDASSVIETISYGKASYMGTEIHIKPVGLPTTNLKTALIELLRVLRSIRNNNVNQFVGCYLDSNSFNLAYEHCSRGSLRDIIAHTTRHLDWEFKNSLLKDLVRGMNYLHKSPIKVHGRLKSSNCLIDARWVLKITDYGVVNVQAMYGYFQALAPEEMLWTAPELLRDLTEVHMGTPKGDVYSFAIIMQEIICRCAPFPGCELSAAEIVAKIRSAPPIFRPDISDVDAPPVYKEVMEMAWAENPDNRPTFQELQDKMKKICEGQKGNIMDHMMYMMELYSADLEAQIQARTDELEEEKRKTEALIAKMLPLSVAQALVAGESVDPEAFDEVTIYFSDIVGFSAISAKSTPLQIVKLLNGLYSVFDANIERFDVYKVETIGDAYMVASGLPIRNGRNHAGEIAKMALEMLSISGLFVIPYLPTIPILMRIGIHSGPCVAGIVGLTNPRYCLFGDTVNSASRMESAGEALRIHVSPATKIILDELGGYKFEYRGKVSLKGRGEVETYWLVGREGFDGPLPTPLKTDA
uniref:Guanylate cyclase n=1 Tax=Schistocephalus solidus TaxID=70667 RepID=A0A183SFY8_SCHSO